MLRLSQPNIDHSPNFITGNTLNKENCYNCIKLKINEQENEFHFQFEEIALHDEE